MAKNAVLIKLLSEFDGKDLARAQREIAKMQAKTQTFGKKFEAMGRKIQDVGASVSKAGGGLTKGLTLPIVGIGVLSLKAAGDFEKSMNKVRAISGATGEDFTDLRDLAQELGRTTAFTAGQAADGMSFLAMAGFKTNDILESMPGVLSLAAAGQMDLATAADISSNILTGFGRTSDQMSSTVDILAKTFTSSNTDLVQLGDAMKYVGPIAASAGMGFEETAAAVGLLGNAGIQGSMAGTTLRNVISRLLDPSKKAANTMADLGIQAEDGSFAFLDAEGNLKSFADIMDVFAKSGASTADLMAVFGARAGPGMAALLGQGSGALTELTGMLETSGGTADNIASTQLEGLNGAVTKLKSAFEGLMISLADSGLLDRAADLVEQLTMFVGKLTEGFRTLPQPMQEMIIKVAGIAAAIGPVLLVVGKLISIFGAIVAAINPVTLIIAGVVLAAAALAAGFMYLWKNSQTLRDAVKAAFERIRAAVIGVIDQVKKTLEENRETLMQLRDGFKIAAQFIADKVVPIIVEFYSIYLTKLIQVIGFIISALINLIGFWVKVIGKIAEVSVAIGEFSTEAVSRIQEFVSGVQTAFVETFTAIRDFIANVFNTVKDTIESTIKGAINFVIRGINKIIGAWNSLKFEVPQFTVGVGPASKTFGPFSIGTKGLASIPALAQGGIVTQPTLALIGEAGPEAVVPLSRGMSGSNSTSNIVINVNAGIGTDGRAVGRQIVEALKQYERQNGPLPVKVA